MCSQGESQYSSVSGNLVVFLVAEYGLSRASHQYDNKTPAIRWNIASCPFTLALLATLTLSRRSRNKMDDGSQFDPRQFVGKHKLSLPCPSLCISLPVVKRNAAQLHKNVNKAGVTLRAHLKTNKVRSWISYLPQLTKFQTTEVTRIMLGNSLSKVAISTLREADGIEPLIAEGTVRDVHSHHPSTNRANSESRFCGLFQLVHQSCLD